LSTILRALKKLENDPRHLEDNQTLAYKFVPLADTAPEKPLGNIILVAVAGGLACGLVFFAGWWVFSEKNPPLPVSPPEVSQQVSTPQQYIPAATEELPPPGPAAPEKNASLSTESAAAPETADTVAAPGPASLYEPDSQEISPEETAQIQGAAGAEAVSPPQTISKATSETVAPPAKKRSSAAAGMAKANVPREKVEIPRLNDPNMKLQALTWSREPHKRIAVINNRILREGETVSGYLLVTINQDDVVLGREGKTWKLLFHTK
jgi:hypothetical protein